MRVLAAILACVVIAIVLVDCFYTVVLGRRTERTIRVAGWFYRFTWPAFRG